MNYCCKTLIFLGLICLSNLQAATSEDVSTSTATSAKRKLPFIKGVIEDFDATTYKFKVTAVGGPDGTATSPLKNGDYFSCAETLKHVIAKLLGDKADLPVGQVLEFQAPSITGNKIEDSGPIAVLPSAL